MFGKGGIGNLLKNAGKMQELMQKAQEELAKAEVVGEAGAGAVKVTMSGKFDVKKIELSDDIVKEDKEILQDLIVAATNDAKAKAEELAQSAMGDMGSLLGG